MMTSSVVFVFVDFFSLFCKMFQLFLNKVAFIQDETGRSYAVTSDGDTFLHGKDNKLVDVLIKSISFVDRTCKAFVCLFDFFR